MASAAAKQPASRVDVFQIVRGRTFDAGVSVLRSVVVRVAIQPSLAQFCGRDNGMPGRVRVLARVTVRGAVAAESRATFLAGTKMHPGLAARDARLAHLAPGQLQFGDR